MKVNHRMKLPMKEMHLKLFRKKLMKVYLKCLIILNQLLNFVKSKIHF